MRPLADKVISNNSADCRAACEIQHIANEKCVKTADNLELPSALMYILEMPDNKMQPKTSENVS